MSLAMLSSTHPQRSEYGEGGEANEVRGGLGYKFAVRIYQFKDIRPGWQRCLKTNRTQARNKPNAFRATHVNHHARFDFDCQVKLRLHLDRVEGPKWHFNRFDEGE